MSGVTIESGTAARQLRERLTDKNFLERVPTPRRRVSRYARKRNWTEYFRKPCGSTRKTATSTSSGTDP